MIGLSLRPSASDLSLLTRSSYELLSVKLLYTEFLHEVQSPSQTLLYTMALVAKRLAPLKPEIRLAQAVSAFEADLTSEQKADFRISRTQTQKSPPDLSDVMRLTAEIDRQRAGRRCVGPRMTNFLQAVQQYAALGDVIVGGSQNILACGVWALVRMSLLVCFLLPLFDGS